jgi:hypothetical protein
LEGKNMEDMLLRASFGEDREVWISGVSRDTFEANEVDDLGTDFGYFLMTGKRTPGGHGARILAKAASAQAALELFGMLTSRTKRCAPLVEEPVISSVGSVTQFPAKRESGKILSREKAMQRKTKPAAAGPTKRQRRADGAAGSR